MNNTYTIAIDLMGGDLGHNIPISAVKTLVTQHKNIKFLLFGDESLISKKDQQDLSSSCTIIHCNKYIKQADNVISAVKNSKETSMRLAIEAVRKNEADAIVSSGNTGVLMALSKILLGTLPFIDRPAIAGIIPTMKGKVLVLDLGANAECNANNLVQFAILGNILAKIVLKKKY